MFHHAHLNELVNTIRENLKDLASFWVVLYGSHARNEATKRSDIDIAVMTRTTDPKYNRKIYFSILHLNRPPYDLKIFELMPLSLKHEVMKNYVVIFGDRLEISEYLYYWRKLWKDFEPRYRENQITTFEELWEGIKRRQQLKKVKKR